MSISKVQQVKLETTAEYKPISDLNVRFFNQDINTSVFDFIITRNSVPIPLGEDNVEGSIVLKSDKFKISDEVKIKDGFNGIVTYTLPKAILERPGKVTGQIYIGVKGKEDTVVQRLFSFNIEDSLINSFDAETKLMYIRKFDQLEEQISRRVESIEEAIEHSEDYVTKVIDEKETALKQIDNEKSKIFKKIDDEKENINSLKSQYIDEMDEKGTEINQSIDKFKGDFDLENYITETKSKNWQKYKLTNDTGRRFFKEGLDLLNLDTGYYETWNAVNGPLDGNTGTFEVNVTTGSSGQKTVVATQSHLNKTFINTIHTDGRDRGWKELTSQIETTGWKDLTLKNDVEDYKTVELPQYKIDYIGENIYVYLRGAITNIKRENTTVANIPLPKDLETPYNFVQVTSVKENKSQTARWFLKEDGDLIMEQVSYNKDNMTGKEWFPISTNFQL